MAELVRVLIVIRRVSEDPRANLVTLPPEYSQGLCLVMHHDVIIKVTILFKRGMHRTDSNESNRRQGVYFDDGNQYANNETSE